MDKSKFINSIKEGALKGQASYNILPSLTMSQAVLESGWGTSKLAQRANNLFGIKAFSDWTGKRITMQTAEWYNNKMQIVNAEFRAYGSFNESIEDHNNLLSYSRYKQVCSCKDYKSACQKVYECGYATDPNYPKKLISIIEENRLYEFDGENVYGNKIRKFQHLCNEINIKDSEGKYLVEDNILGWRTRSCIPKMPLLKQGSKGKAVVFVQEVVGAISVDGDFGPITKECVIRYQRNKNILVDGIVGRQTWEALLN